jgi:hypothetical protein
MDNNFLDFFFRNNSEDKTLVKSYIGSGILTAIPGVSPYNAVEGPVILEGETAPYLIKQIIRSDNPQFSDSISFYKLVGLLEHEATTPVYVRTYPLGRRDNKGNNLPEYQMSYNKKMEDYSSTFKENKLEANAYKIEEIKAVIGNEYLFDSLKNKSIVTKEHSLTAPIKQLVRGDINEEEIDFKEC